MKIWDMPGPYVSTEPTSESPEAKAVRLINRQLEELRQTVRMMNHKRAEFKAWHDTTAGILDRFLGPDSEHTTRFERTSFSGSIRVRPFASRPLPPDYVSSEDMAMFSRGCEGAEATLKAAIRTIEDFGVHVEQPKPSPARKGRGGDGGGIHFSAPMNIQNFAIAGGDQTIGHIGNKTGIDLKEIADLLRQSLDITPRQLNDAVKGLEVLGAEEQKPTEKRDWKSILTYGQLVLGVMGKAADLGHKLAPYTAYIVALVEAAKHHS